MHQWTMLVSLQATTALLLGLSIVGGRERDVVLTVDRHHPVGRDLSGRHRAIDLRENVRECGLHIGGVESRRLDERELVALGVTKQMVVSR